MTSQQDFSLMSDTELRAVLRAAGGAFHGPRIEHLSIPESDIFAFLRGLARHEPRLAVCKTCAQTFDLSDKHQCPGLQRKLRPATESKYHKLDDAERVCFYEQEFYVLSNFSAFEVRLMGWTFKTSEHAHHWMKFPDARALDIRRDLLNATSAHDTFKIAERNKDRRRPDWDLVKVDTMRRILRAKADQHEYVRRKLLETGDRELVEDSWRDDFWGWGPNHDGQNMLGRLWMEIRAELRAAAASTQS